MSFFLLGENLANNYNVKSFQVYQYVHQANLGKLFKPKFQGRQEHDVITSCLWKAYKIKGKRDNYFLKYSKVCETQCLQFKPKVTAYSHEGTAPNATFLLDIQELCNKVIITNPGRPWNLIPAFFQRPSLWSVLRECVFFFFFAL